MGPKKKEPVEIPAHQQRCIIYDQENDKRRSQAANSNQKSKGEDSTHDLTFETTNTKIKNPNGNKSTVKLSNAIEESSRNVSDSIGKQVLSEMNKDQIELSQKVFSGDQKMMSWSIEEFYNHLLNNAKDPEYKPRIKFMDEKIPINHIKTQDTPDTQFNLVEEKVVDCSLQRDLCWTLKQLNYYLHTIVNWKGSKSGNASILPVPMPPVLMYYDPETDTYSIFAGQHRVIFMIAFYLARVPIVGASTIGVSQCDSRFLFTSLPTNSKSFGSSNCYPPGCKNWPSYWNLVKDGIIKPDDDIKDISETNTLNLMFKTLDNFITGVTQESIDKSYQNENSRIMCYNYLDKEGFGHHETYDDAMEEVKSSDGTKMKEQKQSNGFYDWHRQVAETRFPITVYNTKFATPEQIKVLSHMDNVRIPKESLGVWFLQTPGAFNDTLKYIEPMLMDFLRVCEYKDQCKPYVFYEYNELRWVLLARYVMCLHMGFGSCSKASFSYADMSREVDMIRNIVTHESFEWGDPVLISKRICTVIKIIQDVISVMNEERSSNASEYLYNFYYDEYKFFTVSIVVYHWINMLPIKDGNVMLTPATYDFIKDVAITAIMMSSVCFTYQMIAEKKRTEELNVPGVNVDDIKYEFHVDLKTLHKPGGSKKLGEGGRGELYYIYLFLQTGNVITSKEKNSTENLSRYMLDEKLNLFYNAQGKFKENFLMTNSENTKFVKRPMDIIAGILKEGTCKGIEILQRSSIGIFANIINQLCYFQFKNRIQRFIERTSCMLIPAHYDKDYLYAICLEPKMQQITKICIVSNKSPLFTVGAAIEFENKDKRVKNSGAKKNGVKKATGAKRGRKPGSTSKVPKSVAKNKKKQKVTINYEEDDDEEEDSEDDELDVIPEAYDDEDDEEEEDDITEAKPMEEDDDDEDEEDIPKLPSGKIKGVAML